MTVPEQSAYPSSKVSTEIILRRIALRFWPKRLGRAVRMDSLAELLYTRFEQLGTLSDLDEAVTLERNVLELHPEGHPDRSTSLGNLALYLYSRFKQLGRLSDLDEALALERNVLKLYPEGHPDRATLLANLAASLHSRFKELGSHSDINEALALERNVSELCAEGHPDQATSLGNLALLHHSRFERLGTFPDLEKALSLERNVLELCPEGRPDRATSLANLARYLYSRFKQLGRLSDLDEALELERDALELRLDGHPDRALSLGNRALYLHSRFKQLGSHSDLDEALVLERNAMKLRPDGHPDRALSLGNLALYLHFRFEQLGMLSDLEEAFALERNLLELRPEGHPRRATSLGHLALYFRARFKRFGTLSDLEEALSLEHNVLELCPEGHPDRATSLGNLASSLHSRFERLGTLCDLDEAFSLRRNVVELRPEGHPDRATSLASLAASLHSRFKQFGTLSDLDEALALERNVLDLYPEGHPDRVTSLAKLAASLYSHFKQLGTPSDLDEALALRRNVLELRPGEHPDQSTSLSNLALYLHARFKQLGTLSDLDEALALQRNVLELYPEGHPDRAISLGNLASSLHSRFKQFGALSDLNEALTLERDTLALRPDGHPLRAISLGKLATYHHARFKCSTSPNTSDLQEAFALYSQLRHLSHSVSSYDVEWCKSWIQLAEECKHNTTVLAYQTFLRFTTHHLTTLSSLPQHLVILKQLMASIAVDAFSACIRYGKHVDAVELLEQGRGVFWSQLSRLRSPLDEVIASGGTGKKLTEEFTRLASLLRTVLDASHNAESQHDRACSLNIQLQDIVTEIRKLPGLPRFLLPPLLSDLRIAASSGPVIIVNASHYSCDALIVLADKDPVHITLPITKSDVSKLSLDLRTLTSRARFSDLTREFMMFLRQLWDMVVFPIVNILQEFCPRGSRIWWCPTSELSLLPFHAAGAFRKGQPMLSELYISSYTPTLTALNRARQKRPLDPSIERHRFLVVGQAKAPGQCALASVDTELSNISQRIGSFMTLTCVQDQDATVAKVAEEFQKNEFVHLACHGIPDQKQPFESGFALGDELLKVEKIMQYDLQNAQFAYLSACHTTVGESPDEVIHLAAAMQFAGFRSVIGTMWAMDDGSTNEITAKFYEYMLDESGRLDHTRAALALHRTMISLRSSKIPLDQRILYVHIGA